MSRLYLQKKSGILKSKVPYFEIKSQVLTFQNTLILFVTYDTIFEYSFCIFLTISICLELNFLANSLSESFNS